MPDYIIVITVNMHPLCIDKESGIALVCDMLDKSLIDLTATEQVRDFRLTCEGCDI